MALSSSSIPMRWPGGPSRSPGAPRRRASRPRPKETLQRWQDPASLEILKGTPVNCLLVSWAAGLPQDPEQQKALVPLIEAGRRNGLSIVGWVEGSADQEAAIAAGKQAGLAAVAIENYQGKSTFPVVAWGDRAKVPWDSTAPVLPISGNVWPGAQTGRGGGASANPTGLPWIDSNSWYVQMARARTRAPLWLIFDPPGKPAVNLPERYAMAVLDCEAAGARWVISLDDSLRAGLAGKEPRAMETWKGVTGALSFFETHKEWRNNQRLGVVGVLSDFAGENFDMSGEILKLSLRRGLLSRPLWKSRLTSQGFPGLKGLVYADKQAPAADLRKRMLAFVEQGGFLATGPNWGPEGKAAGAHTRFDVRALGKGRLAVAKEELVDPYQVAVDIQGIFSRANDLVRMFNGASSGGVNYSTSPDGKKALIQVLNYSGGVEAGMRQRLPLDCGGAIAARACGLWPAPNQRR